MWNLGVEWWKKYRWRRQAEFKPSLQSCLSGEESHAVASTRPLIFYLSSPYIRALTMQTLSWSLKLFITSNNVDLESK